MKLATRYGSIIVMVLGVTLALSAASAQEGHFNFSGPMSQFMPEGGTPAPVTSGLGFAIVLTDSGASVSPAEVELKGTEWKGPITLRFGGLKFDGGRLTATAQVQNGSGSAIEGVRLDLLGATEDYRTKDEEGKDVVRTRSQTISFASPLLFGDIPSGHLSDSLALAVSGIAFAPETLKVSVSAVVTGLYYIASITIPDVWDCRGIDVDSRGRVYVADIDNSCVWRIEPDGENPTAAARLPAGRCVGVAVDSRTGEIYATGLDELGIFHFSASGDDRGRLTEENGVDTEVWGLRFDGRGNLWASIDGGGLRRFRDGTKDLEINDVGGESLAARLFDVGSDGSIWVCSGDALFKMDPLGKNAKVAAFGPDWHLGRVTSPRSCRVDPEGNAYVVEPESEPEAARVSVFDHDGHIIRVFGRGGETALSEGERNPGQLYEPTDIAFGANGRIYISQRQAENLILVFSKF